MKSGVKFFIFLLVFISFKAFSQQHYRLRANVTIKEKNIDGKYNLTKGTLYYDLNFRKAVYDITFPEKAIIVITDSTYITIKDGKQSKTNSIRELLDFSVFNLCLTGKLDYYGLRETPFAVEKTEKQDSLVITTWVPPKKLRKKKGKIKVSTKDKKLFGVLTYDVKGNVISKQFFENYTLVKKLAVPGRVVSFIYNKNKTFTQITEFKNIEVNEKGNDNMYNYTIN
ncbi:MAG: hypothetical protein HUU47_07765 [Bacteroidetes bacterium]|nr:hypothetical protein [Bacteroidota bacterium]